MLDILIKEGMILDGSGRRRFKADVAVRDGMIVSVAPGITETAAKVIDADGLFVTPGFIDTHAHSDDVIFFQNDCYNCIEQGITFQVAGNCGDSPIPYSVDSITKTVQRKISEQERERIGRI